MQPSMHASKRSDTTGGNRQLSRRLDRAGRAALHRQNAGDQLQAVDEPVLEFLRQQVLTLQQVSPLPQQFLFASAKVAQLGHQRLITSPPVDMALGHESGGKR